MYCPKCGTALPPAAIFCKKCGNKLPKSDYIKKDSETIPEKTNNISMHKNENEHSDTEAHNSVGSNGEEIKKNVPKHITSLIFSLMALTAAIILVTAFSRGNNKLGNPQSHLLITNNFCCQASNTETYVSYPTSRTIWRYHDGALEKAYKSQYAITSIYDTSSDIVIESLDYGISAINKKTGIEREILALWRIKVLNTYKDTVYYITPPENTMYVDTYCDLETHALNLKTGEKVKLANGGCYVSVKGIYFISPNNDMYDIKFIPHSKIRSSRYQIVDQVSVNADDETPILINVDQGWYYYQIDNGYVNSLQTIIRKSGNNVEELASVLSILFGNDSTAFYQDGALKYFFFNAKSTANPKKIDLNAEDDRLVTSSWDLHFFQDPENKDDVILCTDSHLGNGYLCLWDEDGTLFFSVGIDDAMFR